MAGTKISEATLRSALKGTENVPIVDTDLPKGKTRLSDIKKYVTPDLSGYAKKSEIPSTANLATKEELAGKANATHTHTVADVSDIHTSWKAQLKKELFSSWSTAIGKTFKTAVQDEGFLTEEALKDANLEDLIMYGVEWDVTVSTPDCTRIGNMNLHRTLPVQSMMRGCLLDDNGAVKKYLNPTDWTSEVRDGSQGQVMVEVPEHYMKFETEGNKRRVKIYIVPVEGCLTIRKYYVSAYEATVQRSTSKLCSVVNMDADYRGGNNQTDWDGTYRTMLGKPASVINLTNFRKYARNRKENSTEWNCMTYGAQKDLYWLFVTEYATLNSQKAFNASKTAEGYAQGGLGNGVTNLNSQKWNTFNEYHAFIPCGYTDSLGNGTGEVDFQMPTEYDSTILTVKVNRYRGIENPFGHLWQWTDGVNIKVSPNAPDGDGTSKIYIAEHTADYSSTSYDGYTYVGDEARTAGYVKEVVFGETGDIDAKVVGGSSSTYHCDYHYINIPATETLRGLLFGGNAHYGAYAGLAYAYSNYVPSNAYANVGSRLCFITE